MNYWSILFITVWILFHISRINCQNCYPSQTKQFNEIFLAEHNKYRKDHQAPPLTLDDSLIKNSVEWSKYLIQIDGFKHSKPGKYGENLWYMGGSGVNEFNPRSMDPSKSWYDEVDLYYYEDAASNPATNHFTQMVWKSTEKMGCGVCFANHKVMVTCRYTPQGNIRGEFKKNVGVANGRGNHRMPLWMFCSIVVVGVIIIYGPVIYYVKNILDNDE